VETVVGAAIGQLFVHVQGQIHNVFRASPI
jgi:hypothetical protein